MKYYITVSDFYFLHYYAVAEPFEIEKLTDVIDTCEDIVREIAEANGLIAHQLRYNWCSKPERSMPKFMIDEGFDGYIYIYDLEKDEKFYRKTS